MSRLGRALHALSDDPGIVDHRTWRDAGLVLLDVMAALNADQVALGIALVPLLEEVER